MVLLDFISLCFLRVVLIISLVVYCYSYFYMNDFFSVRFCSIVFIFIFSMSLLILFPTLFGLIIGWDGLGVSSFLLVIYYNNIRSLRSGVLTIYINRFGDVLLILSFLFTFSLAEHYSYFFMNYFFPYCFYILFILSGLTKRAQLPFCSWLPAAMSAPTPVSSLVHSSTLVTAGVFLLVRFYYFLGFVFRIIILKFSSLATSFLAGLVACWESDLKKIVAISTLGQLGIIIYAISDSEVSYCFFHLVRHALFKSLIFLCCGILISFMVGSQDLRFRGGKNFFSCFIVLMLIFSSLSLVGFPFLRGFFSKDILIEITLIKGTAIIYFVMLYTSCIFSLFYIIKLVQLSFFTFSKVFYYVRNFFSRYLFFLSLFFISIIYGYIVSLFILDREAYMGFLIWKFLGIFLFLFFLLKNYLKSKKFAIIMLELTFLNWFLGGITRLSTKSIDAFFNVGEMGWLEYFGPRGLVFFLNSFVFYFKNFFKKTIFFFLLIFLFSFFLLLYSLW